jgi:hypothetical protein
MAGARARGPQGWSGVTSISMRYNRSCLRARLPWLLLRINNASIVTRSPEACSAVAAATLAVLHEKRSAP